jgi:hypothetical protein
MQNPKTRFAFALLAPRASRIVNFRSDGAEAVDRCNTSRMFQASQ